MGNYNILNSLYHCHLMLLLDDFSLARKCPAMLRELCVCPKGLKMLVLMLHQEHTNLCLCGRLHNEGFFINTFLHKNT